MTWVWLADPPSWSVLAAMSCQVTDLLRGGNRSDTGVAWHCHAASMGSLTAHDSTLNDPTLQLQHHRQQARLLPWLILSHDSA